MKFECAVTVKGERCEGVEAGDTAYLGVLTFCSVHQQAFEDLVLSGHLGDQVRAARLNRIFSSPARAQESREALRSIRNTKASVYFIRCGGYVKIGASRSPAKRLDSIRTIGGVLAPSLLDLSGAELIATEPGGFTREKALHVRFKHLRHTGEWFSEDAELTRYVESLRAA